MEFEYVAIIFNKIQGLRQCPQNTLNNVLLNFIKHEKMKAIRYSSPQSKNWGGGRVPPPIPPPGSTPLADTLTQNADSSYCCKDCKYKM